MLIADTLDTVATEAVVQDGGALQGLAHAQLQVGILLLQQIAGGHGAGRTGGEAGTGKLIAGTLNSLEHICQSIAGEKEGEANDAEDTGAGTVDGDAGADDAPVADTAPAVAEETDTSDPQAETASTKEQKTTPSVTQDDITKIIVHKLKKDRSNDEKIGAILGTYGVAKVSELPAEKYEAFLTDLSQL
jgi:hypothetical protein